MIVDHQTHLFPTAALERLIGRAECPRVDVEDGTYILEGWPGARLPVPPSFRDFSVQLETFDEHGIDVVVSSPTTLGEVQHLPGSEAAELLDALNGEMAAVQRAHPQRFVGLAMLPMQEPELAIAVLERAISDHGLRGVCMLSTIEGAPIATDETRPVFERVEALGVPVFLHPGLRSGEVAAFARGRGEGGIGWMAQTARAALDLVDSGVLDACPELVVVHPHLGGVLPYVFGRVQRMAGGAARRPLGDYLAERFWTDSVSATPGALEFAAGLYGAQRILFATDFPFWQPADGHLYVRENGDAETIYANRLPGLVLPGDETD